MDDVIVSYQLTLHQALRCPGELVGTTPMSAVIMTWIRTILCGHVTALQGVHPGAAGAHMSLAQTLHRIHCRPNNQLSPQQLNASSQLLLCVPAPVRWKLNNKRVNPTIGAHPCVLHSITHGLLSPCVQLCRPLPPQQVECQSVATGCTHMEHSPPCARHYGPPSACNPSKPKNNPNTMAKSRNPQMPQTQRSAAQHTLQNPLVPPIGSCQHARKSTPALRLRSSAAARGTRCRPPRSCG